MNDNFFPQFFGMINGDEDIDDCIDVHENSSIMPGSPKQKSVGQKITPTKHQNKKGQTNTPTKVNITRNTKDEITEIKQNVLFLFEFWLLLG